MCNEYVVIAPMFLSDQVISKVLPYDKAKEVVNRYNKQHNRKLFVRKAYPVELAIFHTYISKW